MDLNLTPEQESFRDELRAWLADNVPEPWQGENQDGDEYWSYLRAWQRTLFDGGWAGVSWPKEYGGLGASPIQTSIFRAEVAKAKTPKSVGAIGETRVGPTIMVEGTDEQKKHYLPRILSGEDIWCQGYSEPNSGSDLASLSTRAVPDGDDWVVNGQKIWTSYAHVADCCLLLVRTDTQVPKHKGITCLLVDMKTSGVSTKPLRQMSGDSGFNEVFFTDVRVPVKNQLGALNNGWRVGITVLMHARANLDTSIYVAYKDFMGRLVDQCRTRTRNGRPLAEDPVVRQKLAQAEVEVEIFRLNMDRVLSRSNAGETPGPEGSILKLYHTEMNQRLTQTAMEILGDATQLQSLGDGQWAYNYLRSRANTIEGGTSEIQRNIIAERVLGLPKSY